jgi:2-polyprenyl-6-methoxyphenol hydroxylase-like FAD-dependent oxidoreductase
MTGPVVVAGGGLAGAAAAALLASAGRPVTVFEREAKPAHKVCGEFISAEAIFYLKNLGLDLDSLGGHPIHGFRLVRGATIVSCELPFEGLGLSRRVLDEALLRHCESCGAEVRRGRSLRFVEAGDRVELREDGGSPFSADTIFLATGKHDVARLRRKVSAVPDFIGLKLHMRLVPAQQAELAGHVEILLLRTGYAGLQMVEAGTANLCLLVSRAQFQQAGGTLQSLLNDLQHSEPHLAKRMEGYLPLFDRPLSIAGVPYGFVHVPKSGDPKNLFRLGDQVGVIPSFTGDGMSIALHTSAVAATCYLQGGSAAEYHRTIHADIADQIALASLLYKLSASAPARRMLMPLARLLPGGLRLAARSTRVSTRSIERAS